MATHADHSDKRYLRVPETETRRRTRLTPAGWIETGVGAGTGTLAGLVMTVGTFYVLLRPPALTFDDDGDV